MSRTGNKRKLAQFLSFVMEAYCMSKHTALAPPGSEMSILGQWSKFKHSDQLQLVESSPIFGAQTSMRSSERSHAYEGTCVVAGETCIVCTVNGRVVHQVIKRFERDRFRLDNHLAQTLLRSAVLDIVAKSLEVVSRTRISNGPVCVIEDSSSGS